MLKEASDCTDTWRLKTLLSYTVIPSHKSVLSHPLCTDKATKHRLIHSRNGEREGFFFLFAFYEWPLSLSLTLPFPISVVWFSFIRSEQQTSYFFSLLRACLFAACHIFSCSFSSSLAMIIWGNDESSTTFTQETVQSAEKWSFDRRCNMPSRSHCCRITVIAQVYQEQSISWYETVVPLRYFYGLLTQKLSPLLPPYLNSLSFFGWLIKAVFVFIMNLWYVALRWPLQTSTVFYRDEPILGETYSLSYPELNCQPILSQKLDVA